MTTCQSNLRRQEKSSESGRGPTNKTSAGIAKINASSNLQNMQISSFVFKASISVSNSWSRNFLQSQDRISALNCQSKSKHKKWNHIDGRQRIRIMNICTTRKTNEKLQCPVNSYLIHGTIKPIFKDFPLTLQNRKASFKKCQRMPNS